MNFKKYADDLETFLKDEFKKTIPIVVLKDNSIIYKSFKIKKTKNDSWQLSFVNGNRLDEFKLKTSAIIAAKFYDKNNFARISEIKMLDAQYWQHAMDAFIFNHRLKTVTDHEKYDIFTARWELAKDREKLYREKISRMFRFSFDK